MEIPYDRIIDAYPVYSTWAAPALSFERVHITLKRRALFFCHLMILWKYPPKIEKTFLRN